VLLNQAATVEAVAQALRAWGKRVTGKHLETITQEDREVTRKMFALVARHGPLLRRLLNEYGCGEWVRPKITSLLDLASEVPEGKDMGGWWSRADEYAGTHLWGGECSVRDELSKWARQLRTEAANMPAEHAIPRTPSGKAGDGQKGRPGRPPKTGDTNPKLDAAIRKEWQRGFKAGGYATKADLARNIGNLPKIKERIPPGQTVNAAYVKAAIDRARKRRVLKRK
jgi:hypothetical protein